MTINSQSQVTTKLLFELDRAQEFSISEQLLAYLLAHEFPWQALGRSMNEFVESCLENAPKNNLNGKIHKTAYIEDSNKVFIGEGAVIEPSAYITGPVYIEPNAVIRHGAYVRGPVYISSSAVVGHATECKGSILLPKAKAAHFNYVGDSILGYDCNLGAGTKLANLKHNHSNIVLRFSDKRIETGLRKFGATIGNRASLGCNSVANPGSIFMPDSVLHPNCTALGVVTA